MVGLGFDPFVRNYGDATAINYALDKGNVKIALYLVKLLADKKESMNVEGLLTQEPRIHWLAKTWSPVFQAVDQQNLELLKAMVNVSAPSILEYVTMKGESLLCPAVKTNNQVMVDYLLENKVPIEYKYNEFQQYSALAETVLLTDLKLAKQLLNLGANPDFMVGGRTPILALAIETLNAPLVELLLSTGKIDLSKFFKGNKKGWLCTTDDKINYVNLLRTLVILESPGLHYDYPKFTIVPTNDSSRNALCKVFELLCPHLTFTENDRTFFSSWLSKSGMDDLKEIYNKYVEPSTSYQIQQGNRI